MAFQVGSKKLVVTLPSDTEIQLTRVFDAPKHLVFEAMTKPEHVKRWWCCMDGWVMPVCEIDLRIGGRWRYVMTSPEGAEVAFHGVYEEIRRPDRMVHTEIFEPHPEHPSRVVIQLEERDGQTHLTSVQSLPTKAGRDAVIASGMEVGADIAYDRMEVVAQGLAVAGRTADAAPQPRA